MTFTRTLHPAIPIPEPWEPPVIENIYAFGRETACTQQDIVPGAFGPLVSPDDREPDAWAWLNQAIKSDSEEFAGWRIREEFHLRYSWAVPHPKALDLIIEHSPNGLVEIGAGNGYWAYLLQQKGLNVTAYDRRPVGKGRNGYWPKVGRYSKTELGPHKPWTKVQYGQPISIQRHRKDVTLMLCWPPYGADMANQCLRYYRGDTVVYIGEQAEGCTGDEAFHTALAKDWTVAAECEIPQFWGLHDELVIYRRNA